MDEVQTFSQDDKDILQEVMNIAFGKASADLAEVINIKVVLNIPDITVVGAEELPTYLMEETKDYPKLSIVKQQFWGEFKGAGYLLFSFGSGKELISLLQDEETDSMDEEPIAELEKETFMEVGNIIIGACVGKLTEILKDVVTYSPPHVIVEGKRLDSLVSQLSPNEKAIILKTVFQFDKQDVHGMLFLITSDESIGWLKKSLNEFMEQYE